MIGSFKITRVISNTILFQMGWNPNVFLTGVSWNSVEPIPVSTRRNPFVSIPRQRLQETVQYGFKNFGVL